jgi:hypothetical protein
MGKIIKEKQLLNYYIQLEKIAENKEHKAYARMMQKRIEKNSKLSIYKSSKTIFDSKKCMVYENLKEAAKAYNVSYSTIKNNFDQYGFKEIKI